MLERLRITAGTHFQKDEELSELLK